MNRIFKIFISKIPAVISVITVFTVSGLNLPGFNHLSGITEGGSCCHLENSVQHCCLKNPGSTPDERLTGNCGCSVNENRMPADMNADLSVLQVKKLIPGSSEIVYGFNSAFLPYPEEISVKFLPPELKNQSIYLTNLNIRI